MKNLINYLSKKSLSLGNGSGMTRKWFGNDSGMTRFSLVSLICLCMLTVGVGNAWGANVTFTFNTDAGLAELSITKPSSGAGTDLTANSPYTKSPISFSTTHGSTNTRVWNSSGTTSLRVYKNTDKKTNYGTLTFTSSSGNITAIALGAGTWTASTGTITSNNSWSGNTASVTLSCTANATISTISVTYTAAATPTVTPDPTSLDWGTVLQGSSQGTKTISITGSNLTAGTLTISATGGYSVTPTSKSVSGTLAATTLTVTPPSTSTTGAKNGKVTISGGGLASAVEVNLSMTVNAASTVTWMNNGSEYTTTLVANGSKPTFPSAPSSCDGTSTTFIGWTPTPWSGKLDDVSAKTIYTSGSAMPNVSGPVTYHAVFAKSTASGDYIKGTIADLTEGQTVLIVNNNSSYALSSELDDDGYCLATSVSISSSKISSPASALIWTVEIGPNDGYYFKHGTKYINAYYDSSKGTHHLYYDAYTDEWTLTGSGPYVLNSTEDSGYKLYYWSTYSCFDTYTGTGNPYNTDFYIPEITYSQYLTTCASCDANPSVGAASLNGTITLSTQMTAQCSSGISNIGGEGCTISSYGFAVGTATGPTIGNTLTTGGATYEVGSTYTTKDVAFEKLITGLSASTKYYARAYATNGHGTGYGDEFSFTMPAACSAAPTVTAATTGTITSTTAVLNCSSGISALGTGGCAIESYGFVIGTASDPAIGGSGVTQHEVGTTYTTTGTSFTKTISSGLTEGTLYYVRPYATNGYSTGYGTQVSFGTPKITVSTTSVAFGDKGVDATTGYTATFTVEGVYLQSDISIAKSGTNEAMFTIDETSVSQTSGTAAETTITVTYKPSGTGSHSATLTLTSTNAIDKTVSLSGTGKWTVTFLNGNGGTHSTSLVANSTAPSKPGSNPAACDATSTTFIGWTQSAWSGKQNQSFIDGRTAANVKVYTSSDNLPAMTSDVTYYPVYAKAGSGTSTATFDPATASGLTGSNSNKTWTHTASGIVLNLEGSSSRYTSNTPNTWTLSHSKGSKATITSSTNITQVAVRSVYQYTSGYTTYDGWVKNASPGTLSPTTFSQADADNYVDQTISSINATTVTLQDNTSAAGDQARVLSLVVTYTITTYSDYLTTCCAKNVALSASATNGTVAFTVSSSPVTSIATCGEDKEVTMTITPAAGYKLTAYSSNTGTVSPSNTDPAVATSGASSKSAQEITLTFDEDANGTCTIATTFTAMKDTYKDQLHGDVNTDFDEDGKEYSATYTVPNLTNPSAGSGDCESEHYKFVGWVEDSYVKSDGTLKSGFTIYTAGSSGTASEKTYIAIWAKEL